ncbi:uncharacterized protein LODBEIA_P59960 [Lodderomyces beijingensis]|uniref:Sulfhydryl oxidase n=1 Tax=Lodderomyces beijingensis TaxID=1775926 RepID=A0ABP0ZUG7_9ASCO
MATPPPPSNQTKPNQTKQSQQAMSKYSRKPIVTTFSLIAIICVVYYMTTSSQRLEKTLGQNLPINLKDSLGKTTTPSSLEQSQNEDADFKIQPVGEAIAMDQEPTLEAFMPKMANETLKQELGRASWRLFHTILARYPDSPSQTEQSTLSSYIMLFAQVYPCGDCARHFQKLLASYPPQTKSRKTAALWGCDIHNKVNERLGKMEYDCTTILEDYDCGCGSDELEADDTLKGGAKMDDLRNLQVEKENYQRGG